MQLQYDSRLVQPGDIFLAMPGLTADGRLFMQQAIDRGASAIYYEQVSSASFALPNTQVPLIPVAHLSEQEGDIAAEFYHFPSRELTMIGITGTNGKTSISYFIAQCLENSAVLGTTGYGELAALKKLQYTTPMASDVQRILRELVTAGFKTVAMEVSSHALAQHRVTGVDYDIAVFTQLSRDHLDFHGNMQQYAQAKKKLFLWPTLTSAVVNVDDVIGREIVAAHQHAYSLLTYGMVYQADIYVINKQIIPTGFLMDVVTPWGQQLFEIPLLGVFNVYNCLAVIGVLGSLGMSLKTMAVYVAQLKSAPGRMEFIKKQGKPTVIVDFAHTPDALEKTLMAVREHCSGQIYCVFGCGGNRDPGKRPLMGAIASRLSDAVIVTNDNPRHEDPATIAYAITAAIDPDKLKGILLDRREAIAYAIAIASPEDVILVAGKGHEDYQIIGDEILPFQDSKVVKKLLEDV